MNLIALHLNLRFLKVLFSVLTQFLVVHGVTFNPQKLLYANFSNIVGKDSISKIGYIHLSCYITLQLLCNFKVRIDMHTNEQALQTYIQLDFEGKKQFASLGITISPCSFFVEKTHL